MDPESQYKMYFLLWVATEKKRKPLHGKDTNMGKNEKRLGPNHTSPYRQGVSILSIRLINVQSLIFMF